MIKLRIITFLIAVIFMSSCGNNQSQQQEKKEESTAAKDSTPVAIGKTILFFGNSLTAGYGVDVSEAFPALIQHAIDSLKLGYKAVNAGLSGETSSGGKNRIGWLLTKKVDVFVLELGANDGLRGIAVKETAKNLQDIVDSVKISNPAVKIVIAGMQVPPNMGAAYTNEFRGIFGELAKRNNAQLIPFILEGVGGEPELNQADGIHPTVEGHKIVARNVWKVVEPLLEK